MQTPWGDSQAAAKLLPGFTWHITASHGGLQVALEGLSRLSEAARFEGLEFNGSLWYEEDCDWAVAFHELLEQGVPPARLHMGWALEKTPLEEAKSMVLASLDHWHRPYLLKRGILAGTLSKAGEAAGKSA